MNKIAFITFIILISNASYVLGSTDFRTGDIMVCNPGPGMSFENSKLGSRLNSWRPDGTLFVHFKVARKPSKVAPPNDGECTWKNRVISDTDPKIIRMQARNTLKVMNAFADNVLFEVKVLPGSQTTAVKQPAFLMMGWVGGRAIIK